jgi:hypothetical protein
LTDNSNPLPFKTTEKEVKGTTSIFSMILKETNLMMPNKGFHDTDEQNKINSRLAETSFALKEF